MIRGTVTGRVWSSKHVDTLPGGTLLEVELRTGGSLIAFDPLGCAVGERVLITQGSVAAGHFKEIKASVDALIIGSIDDE